jgi:signal transduction histidine kinase
VRDNGKAFPEEDLEHMFVPFRRSVVSEGVYGVGLGVTIVKEIAHKHSGEVWAKSSRRDGTIFSLSIAKWL